MSATYIPAPISSPNAWDLLDLDWVEEPICDKETADKVAVALKEAGFELDTNFKIVTKGSCTFGLSMRSPREGDISPKDDAISRCGEGIGLATIATIEGTSMNGMMGKTLSLFNGRIINQWYMARISNPFGEGTVYIPISANIQIVDREICILEITRAEMPI